MRVLVFILGTSMTLMMWAVTSHAAFNSWGL